MTRRVRAIAAVLGGVLAFAAGLSGLVVQAMKWESAGQEPGFWEAFAVVSGMVSGLAALILAGIYALMVLENG